MLLPVVAAIAALTGFLSGLLGIGGGIIMAPLLLFIPQLVGLPQLSMHTVAGLTIIQGLTACVFGTLVHRHFQAVSWRLTAWMGPAIFIAALLGGAGSAWLDNRVLLAIFAALAIAAVVLMGFGNRLEEEHPIAEELHFKRWRAVLVAAGVGLLGGLVGQGGSFILIPSMTALVTIPTRIAVGSNLAIVFLSTLAAVIGKSTTGQINWSLALPILLTVPPATWLGGLASNHLPVRYLRYILALCIALAALRILLGLVP